MKASVFLLSALLLCGCGRSNFNGLFGVTLGRPLPPKSLILCCYTNKETGSVDMDIVPPAPEPGFSNYCVMLLRGRNAVCSIGAAAGLPALLQPIIQKMGRPSISAEGCMCWTNGSRVVIIASAESGAGVLCWDYSLSKEMASPAFAQVKWDRERCESHLKTLGSDLLT